MRIDVTISRLISFTKRVFTKKEHQKNKSFSKNKETRSSSVIHQFFHTPISPRFSSLECMPFLRSTRSLGRYTYIYKESEREDRPRILRRLSRPYILLQLLHYSSERSDMAKIEAYGWAAGLVAGVFVDCVVLHVCVQSLMHMGMKIRVACCSLLYRKILNMPITFTDSETSVGQVVWVGLV